MNLQRQKLLQDREHTRAALNEKIHQLEGVIHGTVKEAKDAVERSINLKHQFEKRPLTMLGLSIFAGLALGRFTACQNPIDQQSRAGTGSGQGLALMRALTAGTVAGMANDWVRQIIPRASHYLNGAMNQPNRP